MQNSATRLLSSRDSNESLILVLRLGTCQEHDSLPAAQVVERLRCWPAFLRPSLRLLSQQRRPLSPPFPTPNGAWLSLPAALFASAPIPFAALPARCLQPERRRISAFRSAFSFSNRFASNCSSVSWHCVPCASLFPRHRVIPRVGQLSFKLPLTHLSAQPAAQTKRSIRHMSSWQTARFNAHKQRACRSCQGL